MSQSVSPFSFRSHPVRVVLREGEPWFVATDVAEALGYATAKDASRHLSEAQKDRHILPTLSGDHAGRGGGNQSVTIINESGLYRLVLRSRKPEAVAFSDWVTGEVLPSIRKTGAYQRAHVVEPAPVVPAVATLDLSRLSGQRWLLTRHGDQLHIGAADPSDVFVKPDNPWSLRVLFSCLSTEHLKLAMEQGVFELTRRASGEPGCDQLLHALHSPVTAAQG